LFEDLFGFRREFDEMFNRILTGKPWWLELPEFKKTFNVTTAVEAYVCLHLEVSDHGHGST
jgi:hypothetical protein